MEQLKPIRALLATLRSGVGLPALELADTVSGGHIKEAAKTSSELFSSALDGDTREAALMGLDLARLNDARFRVVLELLEKLIEVQDELSEQWATCPPEDRPELRDLQAGAALVATSYARQQSHQRRQLIVDALRGSFCPEPYLWGFQDELLRALIENNITPIDIDVLSRTNTEKSTMIDSKDIMISETMNSYERLAAAGLLVIIENGRLIRSRFEARSTDQLQIRQNHKGTKLLEMIKAGKSLREPLGAEG